MTDPTNVLTFPGPATRDIRRPKTLADLPEGAKALVIVKVPTGYAVTMQPASTDAERRMRMWFPLKSQALSHAQNLSIKFFALYRLILDHTETEGVA